MRCQAVVGVDWFPSHKRWDKINESSLDCPGGRPQPRYVFTAKFKTHFNNSLHTLLARTLPPASCFTAKYKHAFLKYLAFPRSWKTGIGSVKILNRALRTPRRKEKKKKKSYKLESDFLKSKMECIQVSGTISAFHSTFKTFSSKLELQVIIQIFALCQKNSLRNGPFVCQPVMFICCHAGGWGRGVGAKKKIITSLL